MPTTARHIPLSFRNYGLYLVQVLGKTEKSAFNELMEVLESPHSYEAELDQADAWMDAGAPLPNTTCKYCGGEKLAEARECSKCSGPYNDRTDDDR